ncbi:MAG TPA: zf-HC2 domain-containing protein [Pyrinomonadaceae bacterium]|nr:zf-HC2 domain-containing protein [Pyrinomonadaceae bacterium]
MAEHLTQKQIEDYCRRQLAATELLAVADHLAGCATCRSAIGRNGDAAFLDLRSQVFDETTDLTHLTMAQTGAYVDGNIGGEELQTIEDHLSHCEQCVFAVNDLREFSNEITPSLDREYQPGGTWWRQRFKSLTAPFRIAPVPAYALAILLVAVIIWVIWPASQQPEPQIAITPSPSPQPSVVDSPPVQPEPVPVVAQLNDGGVTLTLDQQGKLSGADNLPPNYQDLLKKTLGGGRIEKSAQLQGLTRPPSSLMGAGDNKTDFSVLEPLGSVLLNNRATFRWSAMEGATGYVVEVYDEKFTPVTSSPQLTDITWTTTLPRGNVYSWQVKAIKDGEEVMSPRPPAPQAKFRILDQAKTDELAKARRAYPSAHLTLGLLYADAGLLREAEQEFRLLQRANPNSDLARNLLRQVQSLRQ